jgi:hypothetical protein
MVKINGKIPDDIVDNRGHDDRSFGEESPM